MTLHELAQLLDVHGVYPISFTWQHVRAGVELTDPIRIRWTLYVASCAEFAALAAHWKGKRCDRPEWHGSRTFLADVGERGLLGHVCHTGLPCWTDPHTSTAPTRRAN